MTTLKLIRKIGSIQFLVPHPWAWQTVDVWRTETGGTALVDKRTLLMLYKEKHTLDSLNVTNGWPTGLYVTNVETIVQEPDTWLMKHTELLYDFEDKHIPFEMMSIEEAQALAEEVCRDREIECPDLKAVKTNSLCRVHSLGRYGELIRVEIFLHEEKNRVYRHHVLHELAHYMEYLKYRVTRHGIGFCNLYADLLLDYDMLRMPRYKMRQYGLKLKH